MLFLCLRIMRLSPFCRQNNICRPKIYAG
jgi:hypothetical protein